MTKKPRIGPPEDLLRTRFVTIRRFVAAFETFEKTFDVVVFGPRAGVVALRGDKILMTRQYRFLPNAEGWEIPGGNVDAGETAETAARRECFEETGVHCPTLVPLVSYFPGLDNVDNQSSLFVCCDSRDEGEFQPDPHEVSEIAWLPLRDVLRDVMRGTIQDAFTQIAVLSCAYALFERDPTADDVAAFWARLRS